MQHANILAIAGLRTDGRRCNEIRQIKHKIGVVTSGVDGSSYLEQGLNKVLVTVNGPQEPLRRGADSSQNMGEIKVNIIASSSSGAEHKRRRPGDRRTQELEAIVRQTVEGVVMLDLYPRSEIVITVHVLESDGSVLCCMLNAASLALMDAGIAMSDVLTACSAGVVLQQVVVDLSQLEQGSGGAYLPVAIKARSEEVVFLQLDSRISVDRLQEVLSAAVEGCRGLRTMMEAMIKSSMSERLQAVS